MPTDPIPALLEAAAARGLELEESDARFGLQFSALMMDVALADQELLTSERSAMIDALDNRTGLGEPVIELLVDHAIESDGARDPSRDTSARASAFAQEYGLGSALLLLDCLFGVATAEGRVADEELILLQQVAEALEVDEQAFRRLQQRWTPSQARGDAVVPLAADVLRIGRDPACEVHLDDAEVALHHATLSRDGDHWWIEAANRQCRTWLEHTPITRARFGSADRVRIGPYWLRLVTELGELHVFHTATASALSVSGVTVSVPAAGGPKTIIEDISFTAFAGELVGLIGPSGCGKTTLLSAISGLRPPDRGKVLLDGEPFHPLVAVNRNLVGEVPQEDIVHAALTVQESLTYSARLRLAPDLGSHEIQQQVDRVLGEMDIGNIRDSLIGDATRRGISGGQRKRVNLGQELLSRSTHVLFLDEPTSGLDPHGTQEIVDLVRAVADDGRIVFLVTHDLGERIVEKVDQLLVLTRGGRLAFYGPPEQACRHFAVQRVDEIFGAIKYVDPEVVAARYHDSDPYRRYVVTREKVLGIGQDPGMHTSTPAARRARRRRQLGFLTRRYSRVKLRDRGGMAILLLQAPVLAVLMAIVFPKVDPSALFIVSLATLWFGCSASVREVIAELPILRRERRAGLRLLPYLASKTVVLGVICALQCALLLGLLYPLMGMGEYGFSLPRLYVVALLTGGVGITLGMAVSCAFTSSEAAFGTLPLILIPQIVFGGLIVYVKEMPIVARWLSQLTATRWSFNALLKTGEELFKPGGAAYERVEVPMSAILYLLGFKTTTDVLDTGLSFGVLCGVLVGMAVVFFVLALGTLMVRERRRGL